MPAILPGNPFWRALRFSPLAYRDVAIATALLNLLALALPIFTRVVYDRVVPNFAESTLWVLFSGMLLILVFESLFKISRAWVVDTLANKASAQMEQEFVSHLLHLPHGTNLARTSYFLGNLGDIREFYCQKMLPTAVDLPFVVAFLVLIYITCPAMVLVPIITGGIIIGLQYAFHLKLNNLVMQHQQAMEHKMQALTEILNGRDTIRQLARYAPFTARWQTVVSKAAAQTADTSFWHQLVGVLCHSMVILNSVLLIMVGVYEIHAGNLTVGGILAISLLCGRILSPLMSIGDLLAKYPKIQKELLSIENILALPKENAENNDTFTLKGSLRLEKAEVLLGGYPALRDCTLTLNAGEKVALVGASGAGKTTLLRVLSMETPLSGGRLFWDDHVSQAIAPAHLRQQIGIVEQHPYFFAGTLRENLLNGSERDDAELWQALETVGLDQYVKAAGRGFDLQLAEGGLNLSGGQRQALAIARALLRQPTVLLMDEPTAMMDHVMEQRLVQNLRFALKNKTVAIITHRTPLLSLVDQIAIMEAGMVVKHGARQDILKALNHATP